MKEPTKPTLTPPVSDGDHALGSPDAIVTLVVYGDFCCPYCRIARPVVHAAQRELGRDLRFVYRPFPVAERNPRAFRAAEAAELAGILAGEPGFWAMHARLHAHHLRLCDADLGCYASAIDVSVGVFRAGLKMGLAIDRVREGVRGGVASGVTATPTFFVNGHRFDVSWSNQARFIASLRTVAVEARLTDRDAAQGMVRQ